jgi:hypothetical protein
MAYDHDISCFSSVASPDCLLEQAKWKDNFDYKYRRPGKPLPDVKIALYGKQILQALLWLEQCKYPFTHLHSGNVIVDRDVCWYVFLVLE